MKFELVIKDMGVTVAHVEGRDQPVDVINPQDFLRVIEMEQYLERLFGLRFHINSAGPLKLRKKPSSKYTDDGRLKGSPYEGQD